jgi:general secretion pathway protein G
MNGVREPGQTDLPLEEARSSRNANGFTLLELLIVMTVIGILATIAIPSLVQYPIRAKEAVLKTNLKEIRSALEQYYADKARYPGALDELVPKYLKRLPIDPFTKQSTTWVPILEEEDDEAPGPAPGEGLEASGPGIMDVRSGAPGVSLEGEPYSSW